MLRSASRKWGGLLLSAALAVGGFVDILSASSLCEYGAGIMANAPPS